MIGNQKMEEKFDKMCLDIALNIIRTASDKINFKILKMLPTTTGEVREKINLTKMPLNTRINKMEKYGLLTRHKGKGLLYPTDLGNYFILLKDKYEIKVSVSVIRQLNEQNQENHD